MTERELIELKQEVEEAKDKALQLQGQRDALLQQLKEEWGCSTIKEATKKLKDLEKSVTALSDEIAHEMEELEQKYLHDDSE